MMVAGIDFSTRAVDVVYVDVDDEQPPVWKRHELVGQDAWERTRQIKFWGVNDPDDILAIGLEEPRGQNAGVMYRVQGAILARLPSSVLVYPWVPTAWRKAVGLAGNASKNDVASFAFRTTCTISKPLPTRPGDVAYPEFEQQADLIVPALNWPQDACDAYCIALATLQAIQKEET